MNVNQQNALLDLLAKLPQLGREQIDAVHKMALRAQAGHRNLPSDLQRIRRTAEEVVRRIDEFTAENNFRSPVRSGEERSAG